MVRGTTPTRRSDERDRYRSNRRIDHELVVVCGGVTTADVMLRWGITHAGRFAQDYRRTFGRTPSETLRLGRRLTPTPLRRSYS